MRQKVDHSVSSLSGTAIVAWLWLQRMVSVRSEKASSCGSAAQSCIAIRHADTTGDVTDYASANVRTGALNHQCAKWASIQNLSLELYALLGFNTFPKGMFNHCHLSDKVRNI